MTAAIIVVATVLSYALGWAIAIPVLVPVLNTLVSFPFMVAALQARDLRLAVFRMLLWAATMGVCATLLSYARPHETGDLFLRASAYRTEMFAWVLTGQGAESRPSEFILIHARDALIFAALAVATGGSVAMMMGAVLMNYMGHYVGALAAQSAQPVWTMTLAWHPWSQIRIVSFVIFGVVLSLPLLSRVARVRIEWRDARPYVAWAAAGLVADVMLKAILAPSWQRLLLRAVGW